MTVEDYLIILVDSQENNPKIVIKTEDKKLLISLANQAKKHIAMTDRQHILAKKKLLEFKQEWLDLGYTNFLNDIDIVKQEYRIIDRSKTIQLVTKSSSEDFFHAATEVKMLAIRFPFSKKMIKHIDLIKSLQQGATGYNSKTKTHYLNFTEKNVFFIVDKLKDCNFEIDPEILEYYNNIKFIYDNSSSFLPGIYNFTLKNISPSAYNYAIKNLGLPARENIVNYMDRKDILGLQHFDKETLQQELSRYDRLTKQIVQRKYRQIFIKNIDYSLKNIIRSIVSLNRLPVLFILRDKNSKNYKDINVRAQLYDTNQIIQEELGTTKVNTSVLFRLDNSTEENIDFNNYIKNQHLNSNFSTDNVDVVYINSNKLPKPLLESNWHPQSIVILDCYRCSTHVQLFTQSCDLVIYYDNLPPYSVSNQIELIE